MAIRRRYGARDYKRSALYRHLLFYSLGILLLVGAIGILVNVQMVSRLKEQMREDNNNALDHMSVIFDSHFNNLQHISNSISINTKLLANFARNGGYEGYEAAKELTRYLESYNFVSDIGVYYRGGEEIFTPNGVSTLDYFFGRLYSNQTFDAQSFQDFCQNLSAPVLVPFSQVSSHGGQPQDYILYIHPIPVHNMVPNGYVVYILRQADVTAVLETANTTGQGMVLVADRELYSPVSAVGEYSGPYHEALLEALKAQDSFEDRVVALKGEEYHVFLQESRYNEYYYVVASPVALYLEPIQDVERGFLTALLLIALLGAVYFLLLAWHNYRPLQAMADFFAGMEKERKTADPDKRPSEVEWITTHLDHMKSTNQILLTTLHSRQGLIRQQQLFSILTKGVTGQEQLMEMLHTAQIDWKGRFFRVIVLEVEQLAEADCSKVMAGLERAAAPAFAGLGACYPVEASVDNMLCLLLNFDNEHGNEKEMIRRSLQAIRRQLYGSFQCVISSGISIMQEDVAEINLCYKQAVKCLRYKMLKGKGKDTFFGEIQQELDYNMDFLTICCQSLGEVLKSGDYPAVQQTLQTIVGQFEARWEDPTVLPYVSYSLYLSLQTAAERFQLSASFGERLQAVLMNERLTLPEIHGQYLALAKEICGKAHTMLQGQENALKEKITRYVQEHYTDTGLSLEVIATHFGLSTSYLTRYSKLQLGQPLMKYIDGIRLQRARELLAGTDLTLDAIMERCGYVDKDNFIRKFKKIEGITPMQYRKIERSKRETEKPS